MSNIDPVWQSEDGEPVPVTIKETEPLQEGDLTGVHVSRRPAALVGMLVVMGIGFSFFRGVDTLTGQLAGERFEQTIRITADGFFPASVEVEHGQTIIFVNDQDIPHIVESETLCSDTGFCLMTSTLFNGDQDKFTITPDMLPGNYEYFSSISSELIGEIIVVTETVDDFIDIDEVIGNDFFAEPVGTTTPPPSDAQGFNPLDFAPPPPPQNTGLPTNPYAVGSERIHPFDGSGNPIPEAFGDDPSDIPSQPADVIRQGGGPLRQPDTGAEVWIVILGSIAGLFFVTRKAFAKTTL